MSKVQTCPEGGRCRSVPVATYRLIVVSYIVSATLFISLAIYFSRENASHQQGQEGHPDIATKIEQLEAEVDSLTFLRD